MKNELYKVPVIECITVELENSLAAGSAKINAIGMDSNSIESEWDNQTINRDLDW